jgi:FRG domain
MLTAATYGSVTIDGARAMLAYADNLPSTKAPQWWMFRGTSKPYPLQTSLERALQGADIALADGRDIERQMLQEFKRRAHFYVSPLPNEGDILGWLALMQHYGAPTRLLDWTYSFYVAAFFALSDAVSFPLVARQPAIVWAIYRDAYKLAPQAPQANAAYERAIKDRSSKKDVGRPDGDYLYDGINAYLLSLMENPEPSVWAINAFRNGGRCCLH